MSEFATELITEITTDSAVSSGAIDVINANIMRLYDVCYSIRIILLAFGIWLIIRALYGFFNMFF